MVTYQEITKEQVKEFNEITQTPDIKERYPHIRCRLNQIGDGMVRVTIDDNNQGNAEEFIFEVFDRFELD